MTAALFDLPRVHFAAWDEPGLPWPCYAVCECGASGTHKRAAPTDLRETTERGTK